MPTFQKLEIHFDTEVLPAPFSYRYKITIESKPDNSLVAVLDFEYYGREELTEEDIAEEGFGPDDNFHWKGDLPRLWSGVIDEKLQSTNWKKQADRKKDAAVMYIKRWQTGVTEMLWPADQHAWETFSQELIQAIFELGKKEAPLTIQFQHITDKVHSLRLEFKFALRSISRQSSKNSSASMDWKEGMRLLKYLYSMDYLPEYASEMPKNPGSYISPGDGLWYDLRNTGLNADKEKLQRLSEALINYL